MVELVGFGVYAGNFPRPGWHDSEADLKLYCQVIVDGDARWGGLTDRLIADDVESGRLTSVEAEAKRAECERRQKAYESRPIEERVLGLAYRMSCNPRIGLDGGGVVWGFECWWAPEEGWSNFVAGRPV